MSNLISTVYVFARFSQILWIWEVAKQGLQLKHAVNLA
jgi:hypothetical protein